jgi:hypothetical protein
MEIVTLLFPFLLSPQPISLRCHACVNETRYAAWASRASLFLSFSPYCGSAFNFPCFLRRRLIVQTAPTASLAIGDEILLRVNNLRGSYTCIDHLYICILHD